MKDSAHTSVTICRRSIHSSSFLHKKPIGMLGPAQRGASCIHDRNERSQVQLDCTMSRSASAFGPSP